MKKTIVIGGGAAGLTSAIFAVNPLNQVHILERNSECGKKILMSGGTRCNVLPLNASEADYTSNSKPHMIRRVFQQFPLTKAHKWLTDEVGLDLSFEEETNKWFPRSGSAKEVRDLLVAHAHSRGVTVQKNAKVLGVKSNIRENGCRSFIIRTETEEHQCDYVILASGGLSYPLIGTDGLGHSVAQSLGHTLESCYPALVPLVGESPGSSPLPGVSLEVSLTVIAEKTGATLAKSKRSGFLFTHSGYSGPAVLDVSHYASRYYQGLESDTGLTNSDVKPLYRVNWISKNPNEWNDLLLTQSPRLLVTVLRTEGVPQRLAQALCDELNLTDVTVANLTRAQRQSIILALTAYVLPVTGCKGYKMAEVTGGGVPLDQITLSTMESKLCPGLFLTGEMLDCFGRIGGFNFYWAWATGSIAGSAISRDSTGT